MNLDVRTSDLVAPGFWDLWADVREERHREYWLKGGRGSGKSSFVSLAIVLGLLRCSQANAVVYRWVADSLRESVYGQMVWAIGVLGLRPWFCCKLNPLEICYLPTGQKILFLGAKDAERSKSIKLAKGYFKYLWFEELSECDGMETVQSIQASVLRGGRSITFFTYNPPRSARNWVNLEALAGRTGRRVHHSDYRGVPPEWLGEGFLAGAEALRLDNERAWRHGYLGEVTGSGGQVFENLQLRAITQQERSSMERFFCGLDFGFAADPDALLRCGYVARSRTLFLLEEFYGTRVPIDLLAQRCEEIAGAGVIACDSADPRMIGELRRRGVQAVAVRKGPGSVEHGMRWLQDLAAIVVDPAQCPNAAREFAGYEYALDRQGGFRADYPDADNHLIDAARYAMEELAGRKQARVVKRAGVFGG